ncbi:AAA family ATPase [Achromobacter mucicolens]|uniref:bifunctional aminoglycoside phosphotransferase/ATP-binding protein n=1 Tax=Achromobacter mucicolens TaxID=1389922 RepID=UPI00244952A2|nr:AAA family ATPase [Achromobacter mucicolens]MDH0091775.1 AAA family ATPase [Achromobacter mucicolens]
MNRTDEHVDPDARRQAATLEFLTRPDVHGVPAGDIVTIRTHISVVVLAGIRAFKLKKAVRFPYADFSTAALRLATCLRELELNRRTAPDLYVAVREIRRDDKGNLNFDGPGELIDAVVEMRRFPDDALLEAVAQRGGLTDALAERIAGEIAKFHDHAPVVGGVDVPSRLAHVLAAAEKLLAAAGVLPGPKIEVLCTALRDELDKQAPLLAARAAAGRVRHCHGDLHLRNICVIDGTPMLFDCIEFDDALATIDVLYDLAFLIMDLCSQGFLRQANVVLNRYLDLRHDDTGMALMPLFLAIRAVIRAHVLVAQAEEAIDTTRTSLLGKAQRYIDTALACLSTRVGRLVAIGGLSGSGKSSLAVAIAHALGPMPGARVLSSDRIRKQMWGVPASSKLPETAYQTDFSENVYAAQADCAQKLVQAGCAVIADAVFEREACRQRIEQCAARAGVPFSGFWLDASPAALSARVNQRTNDPSDATEDVVRAQLARQRDVKGWTHVDAQRPLECVAASVLAHLDGRGS